VDRDALTWETDGLQVWAGLLLARIKAEEESGGEEAEAVNEVGFVANRCAAKEKKACRELSQAGVQLLAADICGRSGIIFDDRCVHLDRWLAAGGRCLCASRLALVGIESGHLDGRPAAKISCLVDPLGSKRFGCEIAQCASGEALELQ